MRTGFTLIEALVALVLFQIAALALAATSAVAARDLATAARHIQARSVAHDRVARLRAAACSSALSGRLEHAGGLVEYWSVEVRGRARSVSDSVVILLPRGRRGSVVVREWTACDA